MRQIYLWSVFVIAGLAEVEGCAVGDEAGADLPTYGEAAHAPGGSAGEADSGGNSGTGSSASTAGASGVGGTAGASSTGGSAGKPNVGGAAGNSSQGGSAGASGKGGAAGSSATAGAAGSSSCTLSNTCATAASMGTVSGDKGTDAVQVQGTSGQWVKLRVTENDSSPVGGKLHVRLTLIPPQGTNFDLYAYVNSADDLVECTKVTDFSLNAAGQQEQIDLSWGEGTLANSVDDARWVSIEVRHVSGNCSPSSKWTLAAKGN